ncbi:MAG TPA: ABC transporter substrate-binding protein [Dehalococcoidia bacterium]|nr:ABC transporter substrate-binding protein [Dehalococcoidia bacterium]
MLTRWSPIAPALIAVGLALTACGGGATPSAPTAAPTTQAKAQAPAAPQPTAAKTETPTETKIESNTASPDARAATKPTGEPVNFGVLCDRSGPTVNVQTYLCDGVHEWIDYINNGAGGIKGRPFVASEIDFKYEVPLGVDGYKKMYSRDNVQHFVPLGTPLVDALAPASTDDKSVMWSPGFGLSEAADGTKFPYIFPGVATYHSQALAALQYIADDWKEQGKTDNPKVVYLMYDNPAGRDPMNLIVATGPKLGLNITQADVIPVPATTVDMTTIMTQVREKNPDYVLSHLFGRPPALSLQAAEKVGLPREKMVSLVWGIAEEEIKVAGSASEGYRGLQFAAHPNDNPQAYQLLEAYWRSSGKAPNPKARESLHFARGMLIGNFATEVAIRADDPNSGESLKKAAETLNNYTANGLLPGTSITAQDHGGTRKVRVYQVQNGKLQQIRDWFEGPKPE